MPERPATVLLAILQRHGLSVETLEDMARFCEQRRTGNVTLHIIEGTISVYEDHGKRPLAIRDKVPCLTRV